MDSGIRGLAVPLDSGGPFDLVNGLPVHPLAVHGAVVLIPLAALGLIAMAIWPAFSQRCGWLVVGTTAVATGTAFVATQSGEALAERVGDPGFDHEELGSVLPWFAVALLVAVIVVWWFDRRAGVGVARGGVRLVVAVVCILVALANLVWVVRVGDSGAKSVWTSVVSTTQVGED